MSSGLASSQQASRQTGIVRTTTAAEQGFIDAFAAAQARLPGGPSIATLRRAAIDRFAAIGLPHRRIEEWKYTDLRARLKSTAGPATGGYAGEVQSFVEAALRDGFALNGPGGDWMVLGDGRMVAANGTLSGRSHSLAHVLASPPSWVEAALARMAPPLADSIAALNTAYMTDGVVLDVPAGATMSAPLHLIFAAGPARGEDPSQPKLVATRNIIRVGKGAKVTLVECYTGSASYPRQRTTVTQIEIGEGAEVEHILLAGTAAAETHLGRLEVHMGAHAHYGPFLMSKGEGLARTDAVVTFDGPHGTFDLGGLTFGNGSSHADLTLVVDHATAHCTSRELYHCVLGGAAKSVFQGKVIVRPDAQKTDGKQMARALMLSPDAEFDSKPELEIHADDVVCGHGSTVTEFDDDLIFYCRSRGIPATEARMLLAESFVGEAVERIAHEPLREHVMTIARAALMQAMS